MRTVQQQTLFASIGWEAALEEYLFFKRSQGRKDSTLKDIKQKVGQFFRTYPETWPTDVKRAAQAWLGEQGIKPASYNLRLTDLSGFFSWAVEEGLIPENPVAGYKAKRKEPRIVDLKDEVLQRLLKLPDARRYAGLRDRALMMLTLDTGIRPSEGHALLISDVDLDAGTVTVRQEVAKTHRGRTLYMVAETVKAIRALIRVRPQEWDNCRVPLFATESGGHMDKDSWGDRMEEYSKKLGTKVRAYDLRHAFAIRYLRNGGNCFMLQRLLGHTRMDQTLQYLHFLNNDLEADHGKASPILSLATAQRRIRLVRPGERSKG